MDKDKDSSDMEESNSPVAVKKEPVENEDIKVGAEFGSPACQ